tara:strand:- start:135 stop:719 length:585 start_codon:yes stop_codon:yes gene_type:complete
MGIVSRAGDLFYAFRFLKLLVTPFEKTEAYKLGIVDKDGKRTKLKLMHDKEKSAYTVFHRLVFNIKRLLGKIPGGKSVVARYGAALFLIKEHTGMSEKAILDALEKFLDEDLSSEVIEENTWYQQDDKLVPGTYMLTTDVASVKTGNIIANKKNKIVVEDFLPPHGQFRNINIYKVKHKATNQDIYITNKDITR